MRHFLQTCAILAITVCGLVRAENVVSGQHQIRVKINDTHGMGQAGVYLDSTGLWVAPAGRDALTTGCAGAPSLTINHQVSATGAGNGADATDDVLFTYSMPANMLSRAGQSVLVRVVGTVAANGNTKTIKINFGGTAFQICSSGNTNAAVFDYTVRVTRTAANVQIGLMKGSAVGTTVTGFAAAIDNGAGTAALKSMTETETGALVINVTGKSGSSTANDCVVNEFHVQMEGN